MWKFVVLLVLVEMSIAHNIAIPARNIEKFGNCDDYDYLGSENLFELFIRDGERNATVVFPKVIIELLNLVFVCIYGFIVPYFRVSGR